MRLRTSTVLIVLAALGLQPSRALSQIFGASGTEFHVNTTTAGNQYESAVGIDGLGRFMVAWRSPDGDNTGVFGRRFKSNAVPIDALDYRINTNTTGRVVYIGVAGYGSGKFIVTWQRQETTGDEIPFGQRYDSSGELGNVFTISSSTPDGSPAPSVAADSAGNFVVVWRGTNADGVTGQRYDSAGAPLGGEFRVNSSTTVDSATVPSVGRALTGDFVAVWERGGNVFGRRFSGAGSPQGTEFQINTVTTGAAAKPRVAVSDGSFAVVWENDLVSGANVKGRVYSSDGTPQTGEFRVNTYTTGYELAPAIGMDGGGGFVVAWSRRPVANTSGSIWGQRYSSSGATVGAEFRMDAVGEYGDSPAIAVSPSGNFVATWNVGSTSGTEVMGRVYCAALAGDVNNNGAIEVADVFYLINYLFANGVAPATGSGDVNGDGFVNVSDVFALINYLFAAGPGPACKPPAV